MDKNKKHDFTLFNHSIMWLEKYIEQAQFFSDWEKRKQTDYNSFIKWVNSQTPVSEILANLGTCLHIGFGHNRKDKGKKTPEFHEAVKTEFYKWINAAKIDNNSPLELKKVLFAMHEVLKSKEGGYKLHQSAENAKPELDPDSPEYQEQLQNAFSLINEAHASGKAFEVENSRFEGDAEAGKKSFEEIIASLSAVDKENFHFWPQMTDEEKDREERKNKGQDFILQGKRIHAVNEITQTLCREPKLTNNDLEPKNQMWEIEVNRSKNIIEIQNIQNRVLADIKTKRQFFFQQEARKKTTKWLIIGRILTAILSLIGLVCLIYYRKKNEKRK